VPLVLVLAAMGALHALLLCRRAHEAAEARVATAVLASGAHAARVAGGGGGGGDGGGALTLAESGPCGRMGAHPVAHVLHADPEGRFRLLRLEEGGGAPAEPQRAAGGSAVVFVPGRDGDWSQVRAEGGASRLRGCAGVALDACACARARVRVTCESGCAIRRFGACAALPLAGLPAREAAR
jgi:hypothetical protein